MEKIDYAITQIKADIKSFEFLLSETEEAPFDIGYNMAMKCAIKRAKLNLEYFKSLKQ